MLQVDEALAQNSALSKVPAPNRREFDNLQNWLQRPSMGNNFLNDAEETIWTNPSTQEYVNLSPVGLQKDYFTSLMKGILLDVYHRVWGYRHKVVFCLKTPFNISHYLCQRNCSKSRRHIPAQNSDNMTMTR